MKQESSFIITPFTNPSGDVVFRVTGTLDGKRVRKNFPTRAEAEVERQAYEIQAMQADSGMRKAITRLTDEQLREAEAIFTRLTGQSHTLSFCVEFTLANYRAPERQKLLADAVTDYVAAKEHEFEQDHISRGQIVRIRMDLKKLLKHFPKKTVADLNVANLVSFFEMNRASLKTYNNRRGIVGTFFKFCFHRGWIAENPILKVPHHRIRKRKGCAKTFTVEQCRELMDYFETFEGGRWVPYFALCLFAGIRP